MDHWYRLHMDVPQEGALKSNEAEMVFRRDSLPIVAAGDARVELFRNGFKIDLEDLSLVSGLKIRPISEWRSEHPFLFQAIELGPAGIYFNTDRLGPLDFDPETDFRYSTHNCDSLGMRGVFATIMSRWAFNVDFYCGRID